MNIKFKKISVFVLLIFCLYTSGTFANTNDIATGLSYFNQHKYTEAAKYFEKSNDSKAKLYLGYMYSKGLGKNKNLSKAADLYAQSFISGNKTALTNLTALAEDNCTKAQLNLGYIYSNGLGVNQDKEKAVEWYRKASQFGDQTALNNLKALTDENGAIADNTLVGTVEINTGDDDDFLLKAEEQIKEKRRIATQKAEEERLERERIAEEERIEKERIAEEERLERKRIAEEERLERERIAENKRIAREQNSSNYSTNYFLQGMLNAMPDAFQSVNNTIYQVNQQNLANAEMIRQHNQRQERIRQENYNKQLEEQRQAKINQDNCNRRLEEQRQARLKQAATANNTSPLAGYSPKPIKVYINDVVIPISDVNQSKIFSNSISNTGTQQSATAIKNNSDSSSKKGAFISVIRSNDVTVKNKPNAGKYDRDGYITVNNSRIGYCDVSSLNFYYSLSVLMQEPMISTQGKWLAGASCSGNCLNETGSIKFWIRVNSPHGVSYIGPELVTFNNSGGGVSSFSMGGSPNWSTMISRTPSKSGYYSAEIAKEIFKTMQVVGLEIQVSP